VDPNDYIYPAYFVLVLFGAAVNSKFLGVSIVAALSLVAFYPNWSMGGFVVLFYLPALLVAGFRN
jgi:hypothetical protein